MALRRTSLESDLRAIVAAKAAAEKRFREEYAEALGVLPSKMPLGDKISYLRGNTVYWNRGVYEPEVQVIASSTYHLLKETLDLGGRDG